MTENNNEEIKNEQPAWAKGSYNTLKFFSIWLAAFLGGALAVIALNIIMPFKCVAPPPSPCGCCGHHMHHHHMHHRDFGEMRPDFDDEVAPPEFKRDFKNKHHNKRHYKKGMDKKHLPNPHPISRPKYEDMDIDD